METVSPKFPGEFETRMRNALQSEWAAFAQVHSQSGPVSIRTNPRKKFRSQLSAVPWASTGRYLATRPSFTLDPEFHAGAYYVQEASSMFLEQALKQTTDLNRDLKVLDVSAAPGGKSTHLLSLISEKSLLVSNEVIRSRAGILSENIQKWGYPNCIVTNNDPADFSKLEGFFDVIVIDAPCSGEGLFRKDIEAMQSWSPDNIRLCTMRQQRILEDVWPALKENGILIYSTCTYNEDENENNLDIFSKKHSVSFQNLAAGKDWGVNEVSKHDVIGYRFLPHKVRGEGFFISVMRKLESSESHRGKVANKLSPAPRKISDELMNWTKNSETQFFQHTDLVFGVPQLFVHDFNFLISQLRFVYGGTNFATVKHDKLIPEHSLAVSIDLDREWFQNFELDYPTAINYLRRDSIVLEGKKRFALVIYDGNPLGWVNVLGNRVNNLYPQEWRIRMDARGGEAPVLA